MTFASPSRLYFESRADAEAFALKAPTIDLRCWVAAALAGMRALPLVYVGDAVDDSGEAEIRELCATLGVELVRIDR